MTYRVGDKIFADNQDRELSSDIPDEMCPMRAVSWLRGWQERSQRLDSRIEGLVGNTAVGALAEYRRSVHTRDALALAIGRLSYCVASELAALGLEELQAALSTEE